MTDKRLYRKIARQILDMINSGSYPAGTRLPGERELAERFEVSRVVIREAEISLEALGYVEIKVGSGVYVREPDASAGIVLPKVSAFELTQSRLLFESESAALAAQMITDEQLEELQETVDRMAEPAAEGADGEDADRDFHMLIAKASGNQANIFIMEQLWKMRTEVEAVRSVYSAVCKKDASHRVDEHSQILEALRARDSDAARRSMRYHFQRLLEALLEASEQQAIDAARRASSENRERFLRHAV